MSRTLEIARLRKPRHPLIFIPGFLGSKLRDQRTGRVLWGNMSNILTHDHCDRLACPLNPGDSGSQDDLEAFALYESLWGVEYYRKTLRILKEAGGYRLGDIANPAPGDNAFVFVYDWRKDIAETTGRFAQTLERLQTSLGGSRVTFDIVAHSQGGLIARYYALYGGKDVLQQEDPLPDGAGAARLNKVILVGTPNQGTLEAMKILHLGLKKGFMPMDPSVTFTMPALYQMLPPPAAVHFSSLDGTPVHMDLYDPDLWQRQKLSVFSPTSQDEIARKIRLQGGGADSLLERNDEYRDFLQRQLARARRFQTALEAPAPAGKVPVFYAFGSDCVPTLKTAVAIEEKGETKIYFDQGRYRRDPVGERIDKLLYGAGDGTVLMESLLALPEILEGEDPAGVRGPLALSSAFFVCDSHGLLTNNPIFQNNLLYLLLYEQDAAAPPAPALALDGSPGYLKDAR
ncbi:MAG TPA: hypothetical protein VFW45_17845 [Candidatus Polarisedimenticolia bacterium]|nr:hypothetical protein [Candidatus Polarisedimenticolia bacterium]